ncbi:MAG: type IV secretion system protein [Bryobacterales bacterium]|nr:type IV secretion system protein [Bryobacterales bacterium]
MTITPPPPPVDSNPKFVLDDMTEGLMNVSSGPILDAGNALWMGLALIIVSWTGMRIALSGDGWSPWEIFKLIIMLSIPRGMLQFYGTDFPGIGLSFPEIIVHQGSWLNGVIVDDTGSNVWTWLRNYVSSTWLTFSNQEVGLASLFSFHAAAAKLVVLGVLAFSSLLTLFVVLIGYSFILFAQIAIAILTLFGPLFIPWMIFGPMSFLFWSWFRMMITYSLYAAVSAAVFRVMMQLIMTVGDNYQANFNPDQVIAILGDPNAAATGLFSSVIWFISYVLALLTCLLATFKIPEIAGGLVSGAAAGGGLAGTAIAAGAAVKGGAAASKIAGKATGG